MPITKSAKKSLRKEQKSRKRNLSSKRVFKNLIKEIKVLVSQNKKTEAKKLLPKIYQAIDKAAKKKVIKKNTASRKKSRLTKLINKEPKSGV